MPNLRGSHLRCSIRKVFLKVLQNSQEPTIAEASFLIKLQLPAWNFSKKRLWYRYFPMIFVKFLRAPIFKNTASKICCLNNMQIKALKQHPQTHLYRFQSWLIKFVM